MGGTNWLARFTKPHVPLNATIDDHNVLSASVVRLSHPSSALLTIMWLDRLGANAPPSGFDSRPISPLPRRVSARGPSSPYVTSQQRSARASTASLVSSDSGSTTSLLRSSSYRGTNGGPVGSSLRQSHTVDDGSESLDVLGRILGDRSATTQENGSRSPGLRVAKGTTITEEDVDGDFDFGGLSLKEFVARGDVGGGPGGEIHRSQTVEECMCTPFSVSSFFFYSCAFVGMVYPNMRR